MDFKSKLNLYKNNLSKKGRKAESEEKEKEENIKQSNTKDKELPPKRCIGLPGFIPRKNQYGKYWMKITFSPFESSGKTSSYNWKSINIDICDYKKSELIKISQGLKDSERILFNLEGLAFLDVETTGLRPGAGNVPFLLGIGFIRKNGILLKQYFLEEFNNEKAGLWALSRDLQSFHSIATYNGRNFDVPLMVSRFQINSMESSILKIPNMDLLPIARRMYKEKSQGFSLRKVEERILQIYRENDIPGRDIPGAYFAYQRRGEIEDMKRVISHHQMDIISLLFLFLRLAQDAKEKKDLEVLTSLLDLSVRQRDWDRAYDITLILLEIDPRIWKKKKSAGNLSFNMALAFKYQKQYEKALEIWKNGAYGDYRMALEISKYYEHLARDYSNAQYWAQVAEKNILTLPEGHRVRKEIFQRVARIEKKIEKGFK